ncbi:MAG TPA: hypothetical protein VFT64_09955 [Rickettsiales bacterium]|nr:hypothetical protein [Rickettsiales bacterium]
MRKTARPLLSLCMSLLAGLPLSAHAACTVNDKLVNSCRPWFAVAAGGYTEAPNGTKGQITYFEQRAGRQVDIVHTYHRPNKDALTEDELYFINRPNTYLATTWKPAKLWQDAGGSNAETNAHIDHMAQSIKAVAPKKIFLTVFHEPENDVTGGGTNCPANIYKGKAGTPEEYRAMWRNIRNRFDAQHVTNVVWVMNYMGFKKWDCLVDDLWPGNDLVDWVVWDPYEHQHAQWPESPMRLYNFLTQHSNAQHDYLSKPWGIMETGVIGPQTLAVQQYADMKASLDNNTMPRLKMLAIWDDYTANSKDIRLGYDSETHQPDTVKQKAFNAYFNDPRFTDTFYEK